MARASHSERKTPTFKYSEQNDASRGLATTVGFVTTQKNNNKNNIYIILMSLPEMEYENCLRRT